MSIEEIILSIVEVVQWVNSHFLYSEQNKA